MHTRVKGHMHERTHTHTHTHTHTYESTQVLVQASAYLERDDKQ